MTEIITQRVTRNEAAWALGVDYPSRFGQVMSAYGGLAWETNPLQILDRQLRFQRQYARPPPPFSAFGEVDLGPARSWITNLSAEEATEKYGIEGRLKFTAQVPEPVAREMHEAKREEMRRQDIIGRSRGGVFETVAGFGTALGVSLFDPINVASAFIPVVGQARYAIWAERTGRTTARAARGAVEGAVGAAAVEPLVYYGQRSIQADYDAVDSLLNIALGTALGGGLHVIGGAVGDVMARRAERAGGPEPTSPPVTAPRRPSPEPRPEVSEAALRTAIADLVETGRVLNVDAAVLAAQTARRAAPQPPRPSFVGPEQEARLRQDIGEAEAALAPARTPEPTTPAEPVRTTLPPETVTVVVDFEGRKLSVEFPDQAHADLWDYGEALLRSQAGAKKNLGVRAADLFERLRPFVVSDFRGPGAVNDLALDYRDIFREEMGARGPSAEKIEMPSLVDADREVDWLKARNDALRVAAERQAAGPVDPADLAISRAADEATKAAPLPEVQRLEAEVKAATEEITKLRAAGRFPMEGDPTRLETKEGRQTSVIALAPDKIGIDAKRFQFKEAGDEQGVSERLRGVKKWEQELAGIAIVYQDRDGSYWIVDGHQRLALAKRLQAEGQENISLNVIILRATDGFTPERAMVKGAYKNIVEGTGTRIDAAKIFRLVKSKPELARDVPELPPNSVLIRDARALAELGDDAWGMVVNEIVPAEYAAHVGRLIADPGQQGAALDVLAKADPKNANEARIIVEDVRAAGFAVVEQTGLFGEAELAKSFFKERARVLDAAMKQLRRDKTVFKTLIDQEGRITAAGNVLVTAANLERLTDDQKLILAVRSATRKGPISDALTARAKELGAGGKVGDVGKGFLDDARRAIAGGFDLRDAFGATRPGDEVGEGEAARAAAGAGAERGLGEPPPDEFSLPQDPVSKAERALAASKERMQPKAKQDTTGFGLFDSGAGKQMDIADFLSKSTDPKLRGAAADADTLDGASKAATTAGACMTRKG